MKSKKIFYLLLISFYVITVFARLYWMNQKTGFYIDEYWGLALANYSEHCITKDFDRNKIYSGQELKQLTSCDDPSIIGALKDIKKLHFDNRDSPHTNLYYTLLRLSLIGLDTTNVKDIIVRGTILNLLFFTASYIFFFLLMNLIFKDKFISLIAVFCTFMSAATISNTIFLRPYQIQETFFIVLAYFIVWILHNIHTPKITFQSEKSFVTLNFKLLLSIAIIVAFALLTGYYTIIYIIFLGAFVIYYNLKEKNIGKDNLKIELKFYGTALILALLFAQTLYSHYINGYFGYGTSGTLNVLIGGNGRESIISSFLSNISNSVLVPFQILYQYYFSQYFLFVIVLLSLYLLITKNKIELNVKYIGLPIVAIAFIFSIMYVAPFKTLRYVMSVLPFLIMIPMVLLRAIKNKIYKIIFATLLIIVSVLPALNHKNIQHTYIDQPKLKFINDVSTPVVIVPIPLAIKELWLYFCIIPLLNDTQNYVIVDNINDINDIELLKKHDEFYIVSFKDPNTQENEKHDDIVNNNFNILKYDEVVLDKIYLYSIASWKIKQTKTNSNL